MARPGPGNGWPLDEGFGQPELAAELAHLVLEQFAQGLDQLHVHALGQAADIVVALDRHRRAAGEADALDDVGIERALREEVGAADLFRFGLEHVDELGADELALGFRIADPVEPAEEVGARVHVHQRDVVAVAEQAHDLLGLAQPHQPMVDEDAGELIADRFVDEDRGDRAVDPARQAADHPAHPDLIADVSDLGVAKAGHRPVAGAAANVAHEIGEQLAAVGGVHDLGVEHQAVALCLLVGRDRERCPFRARDDVEARRQCLDAVAVAHPHLVLLADLPQAVEQRDWSDDLDKGAAELALVRADHFAAQLLMQSLLTVANSEQRNAAVEQRLRRARAVRLPSPMPGRLRRSRPWAASAQTLPRSH